MTVQSETMPRVDPVASAEGLLRAIEARGFDAYLGGASHAPGHDDAFVRPGRAAD
jgi:hypothetical protein